MSGKTGKYDFTLNRDETFDLTINYSDDNGPVNISSFNVSLEAREYESGGLVVGFCTLGLTVDGANGTVTVNGANGSGSDGYYGNMKLLLSSANSLFVPTGTYRYVLNLHSPDTTVDRLLEGKIEVIPTY